MDETNLTGEKSLREKLTDCVDSLSSPRALSWDSLPELDLYMDQVIVLMEKHLALFGDGRDKLLTPSMVNNYVKLGLIPPPVKKKYNREHLARLTVICMLKPLLPIPAIAYLTNQCAKSAGLPSALEQAAQSARLEADQDSGLAEQENLARLALNLIAQANASRVLAEKIALLLQQEEGPPAKKQ